MLFNSAALLFLAAAARAILITAPTNTTGWTAGQPQTITWTSVSSDPSSFEIRLQVPNSAQVDTKTIAESVDTSAGSYVYTPSAEDTSASGEYRVSFFSTDKTNTGLLAQSDYFEVEQGSASPSATSASSGASASGSAKTSAGASTSGAATASSSGSVVAVPTGNTNATTTNNGTALPNTSGHNGAAALVPSLALVGGSLIAFML